LQARSGRAIADIVRAYRIVRAVFDLDRVWQAVEALDGKVTAAAQIELFLAVRHVAMDATRWFLASGRVLDIARQMAEIGPLVKTLSRDLKSVLPPAARSASESRRFGLVHGGIPSALADQVVALETLVGALDIVQLEQAEEVTIAEIARLYFAAAERLGIARLRGVAAHIAATSPWQRQAFTDLMDDLAAALRDIVGGIIGASNRPFKATTALDGWVAAHGERLRALGETVAEIARAAPPDLAMLMVAARQLQSLRATPEPMAIEPRAGE
jgi:glutamate dehydrogenase